MCDATRFITGRGTGAIKAFWARQLAKVKARANALLPELRKLRRSVDPEGSETRARIHVPVLKEPMRQNDMGGPEWRDQFVFGSPKMGGLRESEVYPPSSASPEILPREDLFRVASSRFVSAKRGRGPTAEEPWREAMSQTKKNRLHVPHRYTPAGELWEEEGLTVANPAFRFGVRQVGKLRAVDDLKRSSTKEATSVKTPTYFPSWAT